MWFGGIRIWTLSLRNLALHNDTIGLPSDADATWCYHDWVKEVDEVDVATSIGSTRCCSIGMATIETRQSTGPLLFREPAWMHALAHEITLVMTPSYNMYIKRFKKRTRRCSHLANIATGAWGRSLCCRHPCLGGPFVDLWVGRSYVRDILRSDEFIVLADHNNSNRNKTDEKCVMVKNVPRRRGWRGLQSGEGNEEERIRWWGINTVNLSREGIGETLEIRTERKIRTTRKQW